MITAINFNTKTRLHFKATESQDKTNLQLPTSDTNYCIFDQQKVDYYVAQGEKSLPHLKNVLETSNDEKEIVETLYIIDRLADNKTKGIPAMYPVLAKFNDTDSPNIQVYLAGIYRKTQVPDAFGPLVKMLIKNSVDSVRGQDGKKAGGQAFLAESRLSNLPNIQPSKPLFDPTEEIGGAILEYISVYSKGKPQIDYSA